MLTCFFGMAILVGLTVSHAKDPDPLANRTQHDTSPSGDVKTDANVHTLLPNVIQSVARYETANELSKLAPELLDTEDTCYETLGCFSRTGNFSSFIMLPENPETLNTSFLLFTSATQAQPEFLNYSDPNSVKSSKFRAGQLTFFVIHGFQESGYTAWTGDFQRGLLGKFPLANMIVVDWSIGARPPDYWQAAANTQLIAAQIARLLSVLQNVTGLSMSQVHLIGFSLGAHVSGLTSNKLIEFGLARVGRITGLDPAGPVFEDADPIARLDPNDADFVQAFHTNGASLLEAAFGIIRPVGHQDFYPNGGDFQPGCPRGLANSMIDIFSNLAGTVSTVVCNHFRAVALALESLNSTCSFVGFQCQSYETFLTGACLNGSRANLDITSPKNVANDSLYLVTNAEPTYCAHILRVTLTVPPKEPGTSAKLIFSPAIPAVFVSTNEQTTQFPPGRIVQNTLFGRMTLETVAASSLGYDPDCSIWMTCEPGYNVSSLTVQELGGERALKCGRLRLGEGADPDTPLRDRAGCSIEAVKQFTKA